MNFRRLRSGLGLVAFLLAASAGAGVAQVNPNAPPPPPLPNSTLPPSSVLITPAPSAPLAAPISTFAPAAPPAAPAAPAAPVATVPPAGTASASPSPGPKRGHKAPSATPSPEATDTPEPPQFSTLDGIWEIEIQPLYKRLATYEHFSLQQKGNTLSGYWEHDPHKTRSPLTGSFDGRVVQINTQTTDGTPVSFAGYVENMADMVGTRRIGPKDPGTAFTAQHRKKEGNKI